MSNSEATAKIEPEPETNPEVHAEEESQWNISTTSAEAEPAMDIGVQTVLATIAIIIIIIGVIGNSLVVIVMKKIKSGRTITDIFLISLAVADLLVCFTCVPLLVVGIITNAGHTGVSYQLEQLLFYFSTMASVLNLTIVAIDRHDAILNPMSRKITTTRSKVILFIIWSISVVVAVVVFIIPSQFEITVLLPCLAIPVTIMCVCYYRIIKKVNQTRKMANRSAKKDVKKDKTARMVFIVIVIFIISWIPSLLSRFLKYSTAMSPSAMSHLEVSACLLAYSASALNFIIYTCMSFRFRRNALRLCGLERLLLKNGNWGANNTRTDTIGVTAIFRPDTKVRPLMSEC
ncbi:somatostatin receptor type 2-like [Glandiceps talaboti]